MQLEASVCNSVLHSKAQIGYIAVSAAHLAQLPVAKKGYQMLNAHISDGAKLTGTICIRYELTPERITSLVFFFPTYLNSLDKADIEAEPTLSGYGTVVYNVDPGTKKIYESRPNKTMYLPSSSILETPLKCPFRMSITGVVVSDLKSAHFLKSNSPSVNAACGHFGASTKVGR